MWELFDEALAILNQLVQEHPENTEYRVTLAQAYRIDMRIPPWGRQNGQQSRRDGEPRRDGPRSRDGDNWGELWKRNDAAAMRAIDILETLALENPDVAEFQFELADILCAAAPLTGGDRDEEVRRLERATNICRDLTTAYPQVPQYQMLTAATERSFAMLYRREEKNNEAQQRLQKAADLYRQLTERFPSVSLYQIALARTLLESAFGWQRSGDLSKAREQSEAAVVAAKKCEALRGDDPPFQDFLRLLERHRDFLASASSETGGERSPPPPPAAEPSSATP